MKKFLTPSRVSNLGLSHLSLVQKSTTKAKSYIQMDSKGINTQAVYAYEKHIEEIVAERKKHLNPMMALSYKSKPLKVRRGVGQYFHE